jgi:hypothetical protein
VAIAAVAAAAAIAAAAAADADSAVDLMINGAFELALKKNLRSRRTFATLFKKGGS